MQKCNRILFATSWSSFLIPNLKVYSPYIRDCVHGVAQPDVGLGPQVPDRRVPRDNINDFRQQVDDSLVVLVLELAVRLLKSLLCRLCKIYAHL